MQHIETIELDSSQSSITFSSIPQDYDDLVILVSARSDRTGSNTDGLNVKPNNIATNSTIRLIGDGSSAFSDTANDQGVLPTSDTTSNTFGNIKIYISNYTSSNDKSISSDSVTENNATEAIQSLHASIWQNSAAITSLVVEPNDNFLSGGTFSLFGVTAGGDGTVTTS